MTTDQEISHRCSHCQGTGFVAHQDASPHKAFTDEDLVMIGLFFAAVTFFGTLGFGGNFFLAVFFGLLAFPVSATLVMKVERRLGLR